MRFSSLPQLEADFLTTGNKGEYNLRKISIPVKGENLTLEGMFCTPVKRSGYFFESVHAKERVVLHFTAGQIRSDMGALTRQDFHVSTPFVIGRNGTVYQLYSSKLWSGNIGKGIGNAGNVEDKKTIGIEISNYGFLTERDGNLETIYSRVKDAQGRIGAPDVYCSLSETAAYEKISSPFRGQSFYATFTNEQYDSLIVLLRYLTAQFNIPRQFMPESKHFLPTNDVLGFKGIVSHINYRESGKWDIGPAFDWNRVIQGVQAASFQPSVSRGVVDILGDQRPIHSEDELEALQPKSRSLMPEEEVVPDEDIESTLVLEGAQKKRLYALVVGIDSYDRSIELEEGKRVAFGQLSGCVNDAKKIAAFLKSQDGYDLKIETLYDKQATKAAIVKGFREHLSQAGEGDTVLFYYSGHGTQEWADKEVWKAESDGRLECLACFYTRDMKENFLLADKELRYLLKPVCDSGAHVVALFDCCHSGDNTRNGTFARAAFDNAVEKRIPFSFKQRPWEHFVFGGEITREHVKTEGENRAIPEGLHVQMSACESDESAMEVGGEGVFTKALLATLDAAKGDLTYQAVSSRVRQYLRNLYEQKPRIYVVNGEEAILYSLFLNRGAGENSNAFADVLYNQDTRWQLGMGAIHGLNKNTKTINVVDTENGSKTRKASITEVRTDYSLLEMPDAANMDESKVYRGNVEGLLAGSLRVDVQTFDGLPKTQKALLDAFAKKGNEFIKLDEKNPQYTVHNYAGQFYITEPGNLFRPLTMQVEASKASVEYVVECLRRIAEWERLKGLANSGTDNLGGDEIAVKITDLSAGQRKKVAVEDGKAVMEYQPINKRWQTTLEIELTNTSERKLYCAVLYLPYNFGSLNKLMPGAVKLLEPGDKVKLEYEGNAAIPFQQRKDVEWYNWEARTEYLKLIVSADLFDVDKLALDSLPSPVIPKPRTKNRSAKSIGETEEEIDIPEQEVDTSNVRRWGTQTVEMRQPNPLYNKIDENKVLVMMEEERTESFAIGLYFDMALDEKLQPAHKLKSFVETNAQAKSFLGDSVLDLANWWTRKKRNRLYDQKKDDPGYIRIFAEGDSWFQHPLVHDTIDHLSRSYAVFCSSSAGDTLRNYQSNKEKRGQYYLEAIKEVDPEFFLISGGGNDILGSQFRNYLRDKYDDESGKDVRAKGFLQKEIEKEMGELVNIYRQIFKHLQAEHPKLQIIVHGYDYPVKLDDDRKGWLGRYMIEKGIGAADRQAVIQHIMNEFNRQLEEVAKEFPDTVSYLNVRNTVRYSPAEKVDQWYDEIHPNDEGFQQVAMRFMEKISEKRRSR
ncbi:MAG: hypothetical protein EOP04_02210 [Proteobacteria bacterium]|nr:MAG: hypothetical protein EOP04_02210 [Pseudomonadota bacterium]